MKWGAILGSILIILVMTLYQWPKLTQNQKRDKIAFLFLSILGWMLTILLIFFPDIPGPTQLVNSLYEPLGKLLEK
ncbi:hypothetical protein [Neobacillus niacini]|uniref:hypothetical protein n=1 Tax=Neobacillus niacini TaxID=86668 RepID=UPI0028583958|nr:hypothetical protein [Neobacillus niacini]MDR7002832.1 hypothetical protein [Neobacillus niacini]